MDSFAHCVRVYVEDTDVGGIVYYANYLKFMERARTEYFRALGFNKPALSENSQLVVRDVSLRYIQPAYLDDQLFVSGSIKKVSLVAIEMNQDITRDETVIARASVKLACIDVHTKNLLKFPQIMFEGLKSQINK
ncbi:MAG: 4-hydroxybenzoyl-CoA thioesterase [Porticoccaceae bacterium]|mgnify:FL=1|nr:4-hydroxybenzoyl-CoA thioesterase [Porticoccaceae bacterium]